MFTFNKGVPVARIFGGVDDDKMLYVDTTDKPIKVPSKKKKYKKNVKYRRKLNDKYAEKEFSVSKSGRRNYKEEDKRKINKIYGDLSESSSDDDYSSDSYSESGSEDYFDEYVCDDETTMSERLPVEGRSCVYICGQSGSGKTEKMLSLIKPYIKFFPNKKVFLFSRTKYTEDPAYKKYDIKPTQIMIDETLISNPIDITQELNQSEGSIVLFDDCATVQNDKLKNAIEKLIMDILEVGRKLNITCLITSHLIIGNSRPTSRVILNECNIWCLFPKSGSVQQAKYALKEHMGLSSQQVTRLMKLSSRCISIHKSYPNYIYSDKIAYIL